MSRHVSNSGLTVLLRKWSARHDETLGVLDLACICRASRQAIHGYSTGRRHMPRLEAKIAGVFGLTVPALRERLGLEPGAASLNSGRKSVKRKGEEQ